ncbi:MAG: AbrB/MazE/SpoVT family DNA-binding domain-containing protein [bacterium]
MLRKICSVGNSQGVLIPKEILKKANLTTGDEIELSFEEKNKKIIIKSVKSYHEPIDPEFASQVKEFIQQYKPALKELAKK